MVWWSLFPELCFFVFIQSQGFVMLYRFSLRVLFLSVVSGSLGLDVSLFRITRLCSMNLIGKASLQQCGFFSRRDAKCKQPKETLWNGKCEKRDEIRDFYQGMRQDRPSGSSAPTVHSDSTVLWLLMSRFKSFIKHFWPLKVEDSKTKCWYHCHVCINQHKWF